MLLIQRGYKCEFDINIFLNIFFAKDEDVTVTTDFKHENDLISVHTEILFGGGVFTDDYTYPFPSDTEDGKLKKRIYTCSTTKSFCRAAQKIRPIKLPWGVMSGIRPAKNVRRLIEQGCTREEITKALGDIYNVSPEKAALAAEVAENELELLSQIGKNSVSLYIGIPFCPTRCLYCSFVSTDIRKSGKYIDDFVRLLTVEIEKTSELISSLGLHIDSIYIGGGTPTSLSAERLSDIFNALKRCIDPSQLKEFTLEAGRPDTITPEKLAAAAEGGVSRISINPQTMNPETLVKIDRRHTPEMIYDAFAAARHAGFGNINMDLIAGLPDETPEMFRFSVDECLRLDPESITVHSMCVKRAAALRFSDAQLAEAHTMNEMLNYASQRMRESGRKPYYMYRQKNISGNLENVGYAKDGYMSFYNVSIMEEAQTIIALGGGGATKLVGKNRIERIFNFKDPCEYIKGFDEILKRKNGIVKFFEEERNEK